MDCTSCNNCDSFSQHGWRIQCDKCGCPVSEHDSYVKHFMTQVLPGLQWIEKLYIEDLSQLEDYRAAMNLACSKDLMWLPIGLKEEEISDFLTVWKGSKSNLNDLENTVGNQLTRAYQLNHQIPKSEWVVTHSDENITNNNSTEYSDEDLVIKTEENFKQSRDKNHLGFGEIEKHEGDDEICTYCRQTYSMETGFIVRITHSASDSWHLGCFKCGKCHQALVDFHYCWNEADGMVYCVKHFGEMKDFRRCAGCDKLIFEREFTRAMESEYHVEHFACRNCDSGLTGEKYILKDEKPLCMGCYENLYASICDRCSEKITCDSKDLSFNDRHWHDQCFYCDECKGSLINKAFGVKDKDIFCSECYELRFAVRCCACNMPFKSGSRKYEYNNSQWHDECFTCLECQRPIGSQSFIPKDDKVVCMECYDAKYAQKCTKCSQVIRKAGITYKGNPYHKECFQCANCDKPLSNIKFTSREDKAYCPECFNQNFSRRCKECGNPISGFGGVKFLSLDNDSWHTDCFKCSKCESSLVGSGFHIEEDKLLCQSCSSRSA